MTLPLPADTLELVNSELASRFDRQSASLAALDTKATLVVGYALAAVSFLATRPTQIGLAITAYVAFAATAGFGISSIAVRSYQDIEPRTLFTASIHQDKAAALAAIGAAWVMHFEFNRAKLRVKVRHWWISLVALLCGTLLMLAAILVQTYRHDHAERPARPAASASPRSRPARAGGGGRSAPSRSGCAVLQSATYRV